MRVVTFCHSCHFRNLDREKGQRDKCFIDWFRGDQLKFEVVNILRYISILLSVQDICFSYEIFPRLNFIWVPHFIDQ